MRTVNRILKITEIDFPRIGFISNSGINMILNVKDLFETMELGKSDFGYGIMEDEDVFNTVSLVDNALAWKGVIKDVKLSDGSVFSAFFHIDPIIAIENSIQNPVSANQSTLGKQIRELRKHKGMSQEELAGLIGSTKHYISKLENGKVDPEFKTLKKIFEIGLEKNFIIAHYDKGQPLTTISNSVFNIKFLEWAEANKGNLDLIEGVEGKIKSMFRERNIKTTKDLAELSFNDLLTVLASMNELHIFHHPDSWITQAKIIYSSDWLTAINLQRNLLLGEPGIKYSKIEGMAKKELDNNDIFIYDGPNQL